LILAFGFVLASILTGNPVYDAVGSVCIGIILIIISLFIAWRIKTPIIGRSAEPELEALIKSIISKDENIDTILNTITLQFGPSVMLAAKLKMHPGISIETAVEHINALEQKIKGLVPEVGWCFMEPDMKD
jgi:divalent metal cation (Fe/Co/Zn/Cd) transporter